MTEAPATFRARSLLVYWGILLAIGALRIFGPFGPLFENDLGAFLVLCPPLSLLPSILHWSSRNFVLLPATFLALLALFQTMALVAGMGVGDTWVVYPPWNTWKDWLWPAGFLAGSLVLHRWSARPAQAGGLPAA
jgi:hypothetical protein